MAEGILRSPTFFVGAERQRQNLDLFQRREQNLAEAYHKNKPLCFSGRAYQKTHPIKARKGCKDADATLETPMILGVADGVSQIEDYGIDASMLPQELLQCCEELGMSQLLPGVELPPEEAYRGPIPLVREAYESTESLGSTTLVLALLDNSTRIHGKLHPMIAVISIGDCQLLILRRCNGRHSHLELVFHTEMQRFDGHNQTPLQLARVDDRIDPNWEEPLTIEVIERGSAVHCVSAYEGDIIIMGSDGVFDNLFLDEIVDLCNNMIVPGRSFPTHESVLGLLARKIVEACHEKTRPGPTGALPEAPIGRGGKTDDTSCVVAEVIEWTDSHSKIWAPRQRRLNWHNMMTCGDGCAAASDDYDEYDEDMLPPGTKPGSATARHFERKAARQLRKDQAEESSDEEGHHCCIA